MNKKVAFRVLLAIDVLIILLGLYCTIYGIVYNLKMQVMGSELPAYIFGFVVLFLGIRYLRSLIKLKKRISPDADFSWSNFSKPFKGFLKRNPQN